MKFDYNKEKDALLIQTRGVGFEDIVTAIKDGKMIDIEDNPNYPKQMRILVNYNNYVYVVPFVTNADCIFLKTIYPSRKHNKELLPEENIYDNNKE